MPTHILFSKTMLAIFAYLPSSASFPVTSAGIEMVVHYGQNTAVNIANRAIEMAATTFRSYKKTPVHERRRMLLCAADLFDSKADEFTHRQMLETSCNEQWARFKHMQTSTFIRDLASDITQAVTGELPPSHFDYTTLVYKEPVRAVFLILP